MLCVILKGKGPHFTNDQKVKTLDFFFFFQNTCTTILEKKNRHVNRWGINNDSLPPA